MAHSVLEATPASTQPEPVSVLLWTLKATTQPEDLHRDTDLW